MSQLGGPLPGKDFGTKKVGGRKIVSTARNRNPFTGKPLTRSEVQSGGRAGVLRRAKGKSKLVGAKSTWVSKRSGKIIAPREGTREKAGQNIKNVRNRQKLMTKAGNLFKQTPAQRYTAKKGGGVSHGKKKGWLDRAWGR
jgi:hypothetical protein